jgi:putative endonuclease
VEGFTRRYGVHTLVWHEAHPTREDDQLWKRRWKLALIEKDNPQWRDLCEDPE